uniref:Rhodanese domain-containing protein n=1 Tax=Strongyloides venezuelensis TaxID=75913 RepID=A0A0K0FHZ8_STRVS
MSKNGHRNTLSDASFITKNYSNFQINWNIMGVVKDENIFLLDAKKIFEDIKKKRKNFWLDHWQKGNMTYANEAIKKEFHLPDLNIDSKYLMLCYAGSEKQIFTIDT